VQTGRNLPVRVFLLLSVCVMAFCHNLSLCHLLPPLPASLSRLADLLYNSLSFRTWPIFSCHFCCANATGTESFVPLIVIGEARQIKKSAKYPCWSCEFAPPLAISAECNAAPITLCAEQNIAAILSAPHCL
jgi:hypothetical protein